MFAMLEFEFDPENPLCWIGPPIMALYVLIPIMLAGCGIAEAIDRGLTRRKARKVKPTVSKLLDSENV